MYMPDDSEKSDRANACCDVPASEQWLKINVGNEMLYVKLAIQLGFYGW